MKVIKKRAEQLTIDVLSEAKALMDREAPTIRRVLMEATIYGEAKYELPVFKPKIILKKGKR